MGGTGVRAQFYPHQLQTVNRILCSGSVRHLIADEVGLGKTVQTLMVMNALRLQRGKLRTTVLVPEMQQGKQWSDEIWTRAHTPPFSEDGEPPGNDWVQVLWNTKLTQPAKQLAASSCDLLIVDEIQSIPEQALRVLERNSSRYAHLLLLTATPNLQSDKSLYTLMKLLEPDRVQLLTETDLEEVDDVDTDNSLGDDEISNLLDKMQDYEESRRTKVEEVVDVSSIPLSRLEPIFDQAYWFFRRIIRSRRNDYPDHLPRRKHVGIVTEPLAAESARIGDVVDFLPSFLARVGDNAKGRDRAVRIARRAANGGPALRERINEIQRSDLDPNGELDRAKELCDAAYGDSRFDELIDFLNQQWKSDPERKVLIAAANNPTIDYLNRRVSELLPTVGPRENRRRLELMALRLKREEKDGDQDLIEAYLEDREFIAPFTTGDAQLAIAHHSYRQGYNFQMADVLVFFDLPWTPDDVDQWIGRVDRLGRETIDPEQPHTPPVPVTVASIGWQGEFDERMLEVYEASGVFERPLQLDREENRQISKALLSSGLDHDEEKWAQLKRQLQSRKANQDDVAINTPPVFGTPDKATTMYDELRHQPSCEPVIPHRKRLGYVSSNLEDSLSRWLNLLRSHQYYNFRSNKDQAKEEKNRTLAFYTAGQHKTLEVGRLDRIDNFKAPPWGPFFVARKHIQRPPRRTVDLSFNDEDVPREIEFLDHGSRLHDDLVATWMEIGSTPNQLHGQNFNSIKVQFLSEHLPEETKVESGKRYWLAFGMFDVCEQLNVESQVNELLSGMDEPSTQTQSRMREQEQAKLTLCLESEFRFLRNLIPARLAFCGFEYAAGFPSVEPSVVRDLVGPHWRDATPVCQELKLSPDVINKLPELVTKFELRLSTQVKQQLVPSITNVREKIQDKKVLAEMEMQERLVLLSREKSKIENRVAEYRKFPSERNEGVITKNFIPALKVLEDQKVVLEKALRLQTEFLESALDHFENPNIQLFTCLDIHVACIIPSKKEVAHH